MNSPDGVGFWVSAICCERGEVVGSGEDLSGLKKGCGIQGFWMVPRALVFEGMHHAIIPDSVLVGFTDCAEARMEAFGHGLDFGDAYRLRQVGVECHAPGFRREAVRDSVNGGGLARGMDSCVGPTGTMNGDRLVEEGEERLFESVLYAATFGLVLPTAEPCAVVLDGQFEDGSWAHGHRGSAGVSPVEAGKGALGYRASTGGFAVRRLGRQGPWIASPFCLRLGAFDARRRWSGVHRQTGW